jgi:diguanylate cyclase (GGDEF)-like protein/PAS domain S-box-containing protein
VTAARTTARRGVLRGATIAWGAAFVLTLGGAITTYAFASEYDGAIARLAEESEIQSLLGDVLQLMVDAESAQQGYAITGDSRFLGPYLAHDEVLPQTLSALDRRLVQRGEDADGRALGAAIRAHDDFTRRMVELVRGGRAAEARLQIASGEGRRRLERVRSLARMLGQRHEESTEALAERIAVARTRVGLALGFGGLLTLLIAATALVSVRRDLQAMDAATRALEQGERRFRLIAESASDLIRVQELDGSATYVSPSSLRLLGYAPDELLPMDQAALIAEEDRDAVTAVLARLLARDAELPPLVHRLRHKDGSYRWFETRFEPIDDEDGAMRRYHSASRDITARVDRERASRERTAGLARETEQLRELSHRDELTGLLNRRGLLEQGASVLASAAEAGTFAVVYFVDLDGLKEINDRLGHEVGDHAIIDAATLLREAARGSDLVARLGGDELIVLGAVRDVTSANSFRDRVGELVTHHNAAVERPYRLSMSIGFSSQAPGAAARPLEDLIAAADVAMYEHKQARRTLTRAGEPIVREPS